MTRPAILVSIGLGLILLSFLIKYPPRFGR